MWHAFVFLLTLLVRLLRAACKSRDELVLENLALRQQVTALKLGRHKPRLNDADRAFWVALRRSTSNWANRLVIVKPETVVDWQRRRFCRYWTRISKRRRRPGRPRVEGEIRDLIRRMARENDWGAPRILSELQKLGFVVSETTVSRYVRRFRARNPDPDVLKRWIAFLRNHKDAIAGMDFFTVPTATMNILYGFFVIHHDRRRILHFNATYHPTAQWVIQQLREAFPFDSAPRHLIFDRDSIFCPAVVEFVKALGTEPSRTAYRSPWQNPVAERWIGSLRREVLDRVVVLGQQHLIRLTNSYIQYYHEDRCHLGLGRDTPNGRPVTPRPSSHAKVVALPRVGGLHHRYVWREAA
jgi:transposase InsO family protein